MKTSQIFSAVLLAVTLVAAPAAASAAQVGGQSLAPANGLGVSAGLSSGNAPDADAPPPPLPPPAPPPSSTPQDGQTWTNLSGQTIRAKQIGFDDQKQTVKLQKDDGGVYDYPAANLIPADAARAKAWSKASADGGSTVVETLTAVQKILQAAATAMNKATTTGKGGFVEKSRTDIKIALVDVANALTFFQAHPELRLRVPSMKAPQADSAADAADRGMDGKNTGPNMVEGTLQLATATAEMQKVPAGSDGYRDKILADIIHASDDVLAGINYAGPAKKN